MFVIVKSFDVVILCAITGAYWQGDLQQEYGIARVDVYNRRDSVAAGPRLSNSDVELLHEGNVVATYHIGTAETAQVFIIPAQSFHEVS